VIAFAVSCDNQVDLLENFDQNLSASVRGTYTGHLTNSASNQSRPATLTVITQNDSLVSMHCLANDFDSTVMVRLYQNMDSIMVCSTENDFYSQYGRELNMDYMDFSHNMPQGWMGNNMNSNCWAGNDQWNAWTNHMNTQHASNDEHFGGFDMESNISYYTFRIKNGNNTYDEFFQGIKK
jgi:hypothetical protein